MSSSSVIKSSTISDEMKIWLLELFIVVDLRFSKEQRNELGITGLEEERRKSSNFHTLMSCGSLEDRWKGADLDSQQG